MPQSAEEAGATTKRSIATKQTIDYVRESESQGALSRSGHAATSKHHYFFRRANNSVRIPKSGKSLDPSFERFEKWLPVFWESLDQDFEMQAIVLEEGIKLAQARRSSMEVLMRVDPETALANAFTSSLLPLLPSQVAEHIERVFDGRGDLEVMGGISKPKSGEEVSGFTQHWLQLEGNTYTASVYGRRLRHSTLEGVSLHGIILGSSAAVDASPIRQLSLGEIATVMNGVNDPICSVSGNPLGSLDDAVAAMEGNELRLVCGVPHFDTLERGLMDEEEELQPLNQPFGKASTGNTTWTLGEKKLLVVRVDFSDRTGGPFSNESGTNLVQGLNDFFKENSYGKAGIALLGRGSELTKVLRMPSASSVYGTGSNATKLRSDALAAARAAGYNTSSFNLDLICFDDVSGFGWSGLARVGAIGAWMQGGASVGVAAHELGHNFGLNHANFWDTSETSVIGAGEAVEYGDKFDTMGSAAAGVKHFNARYKNYLAWLPNTDVATANGSGRYRVFAHDAVDTKGIRALKVPRSSTTNYWVEFRQRYTSNRWLMDGVGVRWATTGGGSTLLLDMTPGSSDGKDDSALLPGFTFSDRAAGVHITLLGKAETTPESVDLVVNRGSYPLNRVPEARLDNEVIQTSVNTLVRLAVTADDPDNDEVSYGWDFGDRSIGYNRREITHSWSASGDYLVRCSVSDMKGGVTVRTAVVRVGNPNTFRISGQITHEGQPLAGVLVSAGGSRSTKTDSNGQYHLLGLSPGSYTLKAALTGYGFLLSGFTNPIRLSSSVNGVDFVTIPPSSQSESVLISAGALWRYWDRGGLTGFSWTQKDFDDSGWREGPADLGYGDGDVTTVIGFGPNSSSKYVTSYFRRGFEVEDPSSFFGLNVELMRDDGAIVYLNGKEVFRSNMPAGSISSNTRASSTVSSPDESLWHDMSIDASLLTSGKNLVAIEVHQVSTSSTDLRFDLKLVGISLTRAVRPPSLQVVSGAQTVRLSWSDSFRDWKLYQTDRLGEGAFWNLIPDISVVELGNATLGAEVPLSGAGRFFQLQRH